MERIALEKSLEFWDFAKNPQFIGKFVGTQVLNEDETVEDKIVTAHIFSTAESVDSDDPEEFYISDAFMITRSIKKAKAKGFENPLLEINFKGKTDVKGKPLNKFEIYLLKDDEKSKTNPSKKSKTNPSKK